MIEIRRSAERGRTRFDWLDSRHTFSFGEFRDPRFMGFRDLRVVNDDVVAPGRGFGMHPHRDMEILTFLHRGAIEHKDSMGNGAVIHPGDVQRMTAGTGVTHSEFNPSGEDEAHLLQIWILPETRGLEPSYEQRSFGDGWQLVASRDGRDGAITVHQDVRVYRGQLVAGESVRQDLAPGRHAWVQVVEGAVTVAGETLTTGDGAAVSDETLVAIAATSDSELLLFDLG